jgi:hypothetical protein
MEKLQSIYKSLEEWREAQPSAYRAAVRKEMIDEICETFGWPKETGDSIPDTGQTENLRLGLADFALLAGVKYDKDGEEILAYPFINPTTNESNMLLIPTPMFFEMYKEVIEEKKKACIKHNQWRGIETIELAIKRSSLGVNSGERNMCSVQGYKISIDDSRNII